jgi:DNA-binding transcriptional ArsR family regulator
MTTKKSGPTNAASLDDLLLALGHPMRREILRKLSGKKPYSPSELADLLGEPLSNVSYHVKVLVGCRTVKLVRTQRVRGSVQHFYRSSVNAKWAQSVLNSSKPTRRRSGRKRK